MRPLAETWKDLFLYQFRSHVSAGKISPKTVKSIRGHGWPWPRLSFEI